MDSTTFLTAISPWLHDTDGPVGAHLALAIRQAIENGLLRDGDRLPPERVIAHDVHVSRPTVSAVIDELRRGGLLTSRQGSGTWVTVPNARTVAPVPFMERVHVAGSIDLAAATAPDASLLPPMKVDTADLMGAEPASGLSPIGLWDLRIAIAARVAPIVPNVTGENVVVASGAHQALALTVAALAPRGSTVLVEDTTYGGLIDIIRANGCHPVAIERDADGPKPEVLANLITRHRPALTILIADVHSPTGTVSSPGRNHAIAEALADAPGHIVLDETYAELAFSPSASTLSELLGDGVVRIGSMSKALWTGMRVGWIIADEGQVQNLARIRWSQFDLGPSIPSQLFALQAIDSFDDILVQRRRHLEERAIWLTEAISSHFPEWKPTRVDGGLAMWIHTGQPDATAFAEAASTRGVAVLPGSACRCDGAPDPHVRVCFDRPIDVLETALHRLAN